MSQYKDDLGCLLNNQENFMESIRGFFSITAEFNVSKSFLWEMVV